MIEYGPLEKFEILWNNGYGETIEAHQVSYPGNLTFGSNSPRHIAFHSKINGRWGLVFQVREDKIISVRNLTRTKIE